MQPCLLSFSDLHSGADWPSDVQGICPVGRSVLGLFAAFWGPKNAPKRPLNAFWEAKKRHNAIKFDIFF